MNDVLIFIAKLKSGDFESSVEMPIPTTESERNRVVASWLALMNAAFQVSATAMEANLEDAPAHRKNR
jgi:hypothetical protein